ncbi:phytanoyl-CoA dioxygenase family protein [Flavobacterium humi]|uniref:Phytanoyl-CoA dioxygenase n=1 Tax=Flavobacterium humi TaxID=2562683 RepID=A0A4Z0LBN8_9FLAO|nr:phytanoyl-CoA dioxygenase family protein [Flavobacterium humi]TGD59276.1 phytanoyl-CoA dioxygenase [Flavobacterium humi]
MPWIILEDLWRRTTNPQISDSYATWDMEIEMLYRLGISMEDTLRFLHFEKPVFEDFKGWIEKKKKEVLYQEQSSDEKILTEQDLAFWNKNGYIVIKNAISRPECEATQQAIWDFLGMCSNKKETWYKRHEEQKGLMLGFSDHVTLNNNRQSMRIRKAYEQLYGTTSLYKTIDKVSFSPPETQEFRFLGSGLHWDVSLKQPIPFGLQGLLYLTDCGREEGAFHCVPGFHNKIEKWMLDLAPEENPREKALHSLKPVPVIGNAGDFIIWHQALPHCATPNNGISPRMVQYLTYLPDNYKSSSEWI